MIFLRILYFLRYAIAQERTELMMKDLTGKVIDMLEDTNLEAVKVRVVCVFSVICSLY